MMKGRNPEHVAGWLDILRRTILFILGCFVILDSVVTKGTHVSELIVGLLLVGLVPLDSLAGRFRVTVASSVKDECCGGEVKGHHADQQGHGGDANPEQNQ
jgi:hypothetical protein